MKAEEIYNELKNITEGTYNFQDQMVIISKWIEYKLNNSNDVHINKTSKKELKELFENTFFEDQLNAIKKDKKRDHDYKWLWIGFLKCARFFRITS